MLDVTLKLRIENKCRVDVQPLSDKGEEIGHATRCEASQAGLILTHIDGDIWADDLSGRKFKIKEREY